MTHSPMRAWWQKLVGGVLRSPQAIVSEARSEAVLADAGTAGDRFFGVPLDGEYFDAPQRLQRQAHFYSPGWLRQQDRANWSGVDPRIQLHAARLIEALQRCGIPAFVHCAMRTKAEQDAAFAAGHSKLQWPRAAHCVGGAVDIVHGVFAWDLSPMEWALIGKLGLDLHNRLMLGLPEARRYGIVWGGNWSFYDPAHWELSDWQRLPLPASTAPVLRQTPRHILGKFAKR